MKLCFARGIPIALAFAVTGCRGKDTDKVESVRDNAAPVPLIKPDEATADRPDDVLAEVNGVRLLRADAEVETAIRFRAISSRLRPDQHSLARERVLKDVIEQFVARTLLLNEADRLGVQATQDDQDKAFAKIRANLPSGKTLEEVTKSSPMGEERMRQEVLSGIRLNKLLSLVLTNRVEISDSDLDAFIQEHEARLPQPVARDDVRRLLESRRQQMELKNYVDRLRAKAAVTVSAH